MKFPFGGHRGRNTKPIPRRRLSDSVGQSRPAANQKSRNTAFRRNSTLTGSTSANLRSATEDDATMQSPRATAHHLRRHRRHLGSLLLLGIAGAVFVAVFISQFTAEISVTVVGQVRPLTTQQRQRIETPINSYMASRPVERLRPLLDRDNLTAHLQASGLRDIEKVTEIINGGWGRSVVQVKVREPVARWSIAGEQRFVDKTGAVFATNYFDTPTVSIRDESGLRADSEEQVQAVTSGRFLVFVGQTVGLLNAQGLDVDSVVIPPSTTRQVEVLIGRDDQVPVKMTIDRGAGEQAEDAARAYRHLAGENRLPRYIDVRVSGMAYYRPR